MWNKIISYSGCSMVRVPETDTVMYLVPVPNCARNTKWLIGEYRVQTPFATKLRQSPVLQKFVQKHRVRFGLRDTDIAPTAPREPRYGETKLVKKPGNFTEDRVVEKAKPVKEDEDSVNRKTDRESNVRKYWETQTPQSHHIVEYNNLRDIGASKPDRQGNGSMDHDQLPCVLLAAEFHQRYISAILRELHGASKTTLREKMPAVYSALYESRGTLFSPLWNVSRAILQEAKLPVK